MINKPGKVRIPIHTVDNSKEVEPITDRISGLKLKVAREMSRKERRSNIKRSSMPVVLEFEDGSKIYAFIPELHLGDVAGKN